MSNIRLNGPKIAKGLTLGRISAAQSAGLKVSAFKDEISTDMEIVTANWR